MGDAIVDDDDECAAFSGSFEFHEVHGSLRLESMRLLYRNVSYVHVVPHRPAESDAVTTSTVVSLPSGVL